MNDRQRAALEQARALYERGIALASEGLLEQAEHAYRQSLELVPWAEPAWFNLGLVYKRLHRWEDALHCNQRAAGLDPTDEAAWWNAGIAATALRDWAAARTAWSGFGLTIPEGNGPLDINLGWAPIRLNPDMRGEVVWCWRIDPARAVIRNVPLPDSGYRWGDCVLHDGEPAGERKVDGRTYQVFNALERWEASSTPTLQVEAAVPAPGDAQELKDLFERHGFAAEDWTESIRHLCKSCSQGSPHDHSASAHSGWSVERSFGLAAPLEIAQEMLSTWAAASKGRGFTQLRIVG